MKEGCIRGTADVKVCLVRHLLMMDATAEGLKEVWECQIYQQIGESQGWLNPEGMTIPRCAECCGFLWLCLPVRTFSR